MDNFPPLKKFKKGLRYSLNKTTRNYFLKYRKPEVKYPKKMAEKSESSFVTLKTEDPASNAGIISLYKVPRRNILKNLEAQILK